jgi:hypothetical protein
MFPRYRNDSGKGLPIDSKRCISTGVLVALRGRRHGRCGPTLAKWALVALAYASEASAGGVPYGADMAPDDPQFGPFDYYTTMAANVSVVERVHMGFIITEAKKSQNHCYLWHNLDYTLRALPNHPQALQEMATYLEYGMACHESVKMEYDAYRTVREIMEGRWQMNDAEDYFRVALNFRTRDTRVLPRHAETHVLYADWLRKKGRRDDAMKQYDMAHKLKPEFANTYYGLGMLYLDMMDLPKAVENARKAYSLGKPPAELRDRLITANAWQDEKAKRPHP